MGRGNGDEGAALLPELAAAQADSLSEEALSDAISEIDWTIETWGNPTLPGALTDLRKKDPAWPLLLAYTARAMASSSHFLQILSARRARVISDQFTYFGLRTAEAARDPKIIYNGPADGGDQLYHELAAPLQRKRFGRVEGQTLCGLRVGKGAVHPHVGTTAAAPRSRRCPRCAASGYQGWQGGKIELLLGQGERGMQFRDLLAKELESALASSVRRYQARRGSPHTFTQNAHRAMANACARLFVEELQSVGDVALVRAAATVGLEAELLAAKANLPDGIYRLVDLLQADDPELARLVGSGTKSLTQLFIDRAGEAKEKSEQELAKAVQAELDPFSALPTSARGLVESAYLRSKALDRRSAEPFA